MAARRFWQVHLMTLVVAQIAIALLLAFSLFTRRVSEADLVSTGRREIVIEIRGFPWKYEANPKTWEAADRDGPARLADALLGIGVFFVTTLCTELYCRRAARRSGMGASRPHSVIGKAR